MIGIISRRDAAATTWALSAPDQIGVARDLLAHSDLRTTIKHYNRARADSLPALLSKCDRTRRSPLPDHLKRRDTHFRV